MVRPAAPERDAAILMIRQYAAEHGLKEGLRRAREQFSAVPSATWARWRQMAVGYIREADNQALSAMANELRAMIPSPEKLVSELGGAALAARRALRFWQSLDELEGDAQLLREFALAKGADGKIKVRVPAALRDAHKMRCDLLRFALLHSETAYGVERTARLFDAVTDAVGEESPECQRRIIDRLSQLQTEAERRGF